MKKITAKFNSTCSDTGLKLERGTTIFYDTETKKAYHLSSEFAQKKYDAESERLSVMAYVQAQEEAMFEKYR